MSKKEYKYAWDNESFRKWWEKYKSLNPGIDPTRIPVSSPLKLNYTNDRGKPRTIKVRSLFARKDMFTGRIYEAEYAWDNEQFRMWWEKFKSLNPGIDPTKLVKSSEQKLCYVNHNGEEFYISVDKLLRKKNIFKTRHESACCWENPQFRAWWSLFKDYNKDIDPTKLVTSSEKRLHYVDENGDLCSIRTVSLLKRKDLLSPRVQKKNPCVLEDERFREWWKVNAKYNPGVDPSKLTRASMKMLNYVNKDGIPKSVMVSHLVKRKDLFTDKLLYYCWDNEQFREFWEQNKDYNQGIDPTKLTYRSNKTINFIDSEGILRTMPLSRFFTKKGHFKHEFYRKTYLWDIKRFREWWDKNKEYNPNIDPKMLTTGMNRRLSYKDCDGILRVTTVITLVKVLKRKSEMYNRSAGVEDPEIVAFWDERNIWSPFEMSSNSSNLCGLTCPICGFQFTKAINQVVGKQPKCLACKNGGDAKKLDGDELPCDILFVFLDSKIPSGDAL